MSVKPVILVRHGNNTANLEGHSSVIGAQSVGSRYEFSLPHIC